MLAASGQDALASYLVLSSGDPRFISEPIQRANPNGLNGLGDNDPVFDVSNLQSLVANPHSRLRESGESYTTFYMVMPDADSLYELDRTDGTQNVVSDIRLHRDGAIGMSGLVNDGLAGATAVTVTPDGRFVFIAATDELHDESSPYSGRGVVSVYQQLDTKGVWQELTFVGSWPTDVFGTGSGNRAATLAVSPDGSRLFVGGADGFH